MLVCLASHACACATLVSQLSQPFQHVKTGATPHSQKNILSGSYATGENIFWVLTCWGGCGTWHLEAISSNLQVSLKQILF